MTQGADEAAGRGARRAVQGLGEVMGHGGLAVGAGDADDPHLSGRLPEEAPGDYPGTGAKMMDPIDRHGRLPVERALIDGPVITRPLIDIPLIDSPLIDSLGILGIDRDRDRPGPQRLGDVVPAVAAHPGQCQEQIARTGPAAVQGQAPDHSIYQAAI